MTEEFIRLASKQASCLDFKRLWAANHSYCGHQMTCPTVPLCGLQETKVLPSAELPFATFSHVYELHPLFSLPSLLFSPDSLDNRQTEWTTMPSLIILALTTLLAYNTRRLSGSLESTRDFFFLGRR